MTFLLMGCGENAKVMEVNPSETGSLMVSVNWPNSNSAQAMAIPISASVITLTVEATDLEPITADIVYPRTTVTIEVRVGTGRRVYAVAKNSFGGVVATGEASGIDVVAGTNAPVSLVLIAPPLNYYPHEDGYSWRYESSEGSGYSGYIVTFEGTATMADGLNAQFRKQTIFNSDGTNPTYVDFVRVADAGVYFYEDLLTTAASTYLEFPLAIGNSWTYYISDSFYGIITVEDRESVTVPVGTFDCYRLGFVYMNEGVEFARSKTWLGDGVGVVKGKIVGSDEESVLVWKNF